MKEFDHNGLMLAEYQGELFEKSAELDCSRLKSIIKEKGNY